MLANRLPDLIGHHLSIGNMMPTLTLLGRKFSLHNKAGPEERRIIEQIRAEAKERQIRKPADSVVEILPQQNGPKSRDQIGKRYNVSDRYISDLVLLTVSNSGIDIERLRVGVKPENEFVVVSSANFTESEQKLIRLGLCPGALGNEVDTAAIKLFHSLRKRGVTSEAVIGETGPSSLNDERLARARRLRMPFGKHRGRMLAIIEPSYLRWALRDCSCLSLDLREAISLVLKHCDRRN